MISEEQDLLSSIRTVRALLDQDFGGVLVARTRRHATAAQSSTATAEHQQQSRPSQHLTTLTSTTITTNTGRPSLSLETGPLR
jgi:hypothetical protein